MSIINTNTISLNAQRNLSTNAASLSSTIQRLSSGLRINSARDDAAGLAISERFTTQIKGLTQASRNANDGISLAQTAEGALGEIGTNLQRIRELASQSANASNSASDRKALNAEVKQLVEEIDRVAKQSEFNGTKLLDGSFSAQLFQVGANAGQAISISSTTDARASKLGGAIFDSFTGTGASGTATATGTISGISITDSLGTQVTLDDIAVEIGDTGADVSKKIVAAINEKIGETGLYAQMDGANIDFDSLREARDANGDFEAYSVNLGSLTGGTGITFAGGALTPTATAPAAKYAADLDITTVVGSGQALSLVDRALNSVNSGRADLGAVQNRFQSVIQNLSTTTENLTSSRSRIRDADYARETAELTRTQILQQAGTAMLAQANQIPQNVLSLLR